MNIEQSEFWRYLRLESDISNIAHRLRENADVMLDCDDAYLRGYAEGKLFASNEILQLLETSLRG